MDEDDACGHAHSLDNGKAGPVENHRPRFECEKCYFSQPTFSTGVTPKRSRPT